MLNISDEAPLIIITGAFRFPDKDAAAQRVLGIAKALRINNINSIICGWEDSPRIEDLNKDGLYRYKGFEYHSQAELDLVSNNPFHKLYKYLIKGNKTIKWIKSYLKNHKISSIVIYNANSLFIFKLFILSKRLRFKLVCDCTEWYEGSHLPGGKFGIANLDNNIRLKIIYPIVGNVIVISSFLENYLKNKGCNTLLIPPLIDPDDRKWISQSPTKLIQSQSKIKLIYAGDPGKKDLLKSVFEALEYINKDALNFEFIVLGIDRDNIKNSLFKDVKEIPTYVRCIGRVPQEKVPEYYFQCHFSILLREDKRYSHAGFPTKLVESLSSGVPVITNCTSDIPKYIIDGENGYLLNNNSYLELIQCFFKILSLSEAEIETMKQKARRSSKKNFDIKVFSKPLKNYLICLK